MLFTFIKPPLQAVDESAHFFRIVQLSKGHLIAKHIATQDNIKRYGDTFPKSLITETESLVRGANPTTGKYDTHLTRSYLFSNGKNQGAEIVGFEGSAIYSPAAYVPQTVAYAGGRVFTKSILLRMYMARLANAMVWLVLIYFAIRLIPIGKWTLVTFGLLPINVFAAGSLSADAPVVAFCFLFIAYVLHLRASQQKQLSVKQLLVMGSLMSLIALAKSSYYPVLLMVFLLPKKLLRSPRLIWTALLGLPLVLAAAWNSVVSPVANSLHRSFFPGIVTTTPADQVHYTFAHPFFVIFALGNSIFSGVSDLTIRDFFGTFTWSRILLPLWLQMLSLLLLVFVLCYQLGRTQQFKLSKLSRLVPVFVLVGTFCLIYLTFYFVWTDPGSPNIGDVQGRYFLPLLPLLIPIFTARKIFINIRDKTFIRSVQVGTFMLLVVTLVMITKHFY